MVANLAEDNRETASAAEAIDAAIAGSDLEFEFNPVQGDRRLTALKEGISAQLNDLLESDSTPQVVRGLAQKTIELIDAESGEVDLSGLMRVSLDLAIISESPEKIQVERAIDDIQFNLMTRYRVKMLEGADAAQLMGRLIDPLVSESARPESLDHISRFNRAIRDQFTVTPTETGHDIQLVLQVDDLWRLREELISVEGQGRERAAEVVERIDEVMALVSGSLTASTLQSGEASTESTAADAEGASEVEAAAGPVLDAGAELQPEREPDAAEGSSIAQTPEAERPVAPETGLDPSVHQALQEVHREFGTEAAKIVHLFETKLDDAKAQYGEAFLRSLFPELSSDFASLPDDQREAALKQLALFPAGFSLDAESVKVAPAHLQSRYAYFREQAAKEQLKIDDTLGSEPGYEAARIAYDRFADLCGEALVRLGVEPVELEGADGAEARARIDKNIAARDGASAGVENSAETEKPVYAEKLEKLQAATAKVAALATELSRHLQNQIDTLLEFAEADNDPEARRIALEGLEAVGGQIDAVGEQLEAQRKAISDRIDALTQKASEEVTPELVDQNTDTDPVSEPEPATALSQEALTELARQYCGNGYTVALIQKEGNVQVVAYPTDSKFEGGDPYKRPTKIVFDLNQADSIEKATGQLDGIFGPEGSRTQEKMFQGKSLHSSTAVRNIREGFHIAAMTNLKIDRQNWTGANLSGARIQGVVVTFSNFEGANFTGATLISSAFQGSSKLSGASLAGATLRDVKVLGCEAVGLDLRGSNSDSASSFAKSNLRNVDLRSLGEQATVAHASFRKTVLGEPQIDDATQFRPVGFPKSLTAIRQFAGSVWENENQMLSVMSNKFGLSARAARAISTVGSGEKIVKKIHERATPECGLQAKPAEADGTAEAAQPAKDLSRLTEGEEPRDTADKDSDAEESDGSESPRSEVKEEGTDAESAESDQEQGAPGEGEGSIPLELEAEEDTRQGGESAAANS